MHMLECMVLSLVRSMVNCVECLSVEYCMRNIEIIQSGQLGASQWQRVIVDGCEGVLFVGDIGR